VTVPNDCRDGLEITTDHRVIVAHPVLTQAGLGMELLTGQTQ
jgi:hypothetical protein